MTEGQMTHALVVPSPIESLRTWCGGLVVDVGGYAAAKPEVVDCPACIRNMRRALRELEAWVPRLPEEGSG